MRIRILNAAPIRVRGRHVLYWMTAARRLRSRYMSSDATRRKLRLKEYVSRHG